MQADNPLPAWQRPYPAYRDSGVPWLGEVPEHWSVQRAKWLFRRMQRPVQEADAVVTCFRDGTVTLRSNRRLTGFTEALKEIGYQGVVRGDLVIHAMDAFAGAVGVSDSDGKCSPVYSVCRPLPGSNAHYYAHVVREMARTQWIAALAKGIRERSTDFRFEAFAGQFLPVPPADEQTMIARFLDHADRRMRRYIRAKQKLIKLLEEQKQAIIHRAVTRGLDPDVPLKPSGVEWLGDIPAHWEVVPLGTACVSIQTGPFGSQLHASDYASGGVPVINPSHLVDGRISHDHHVAVSDDKARELARHALGPGDIVAARRGELGRCAVVTTDEAGWLCGTGSVRIRSRSSQFSSNYLATMIASQGVKDSLTLSSIGATMDNLNASMVARLRLPRPPMEEQEQIMAYVSARGRLVADPIARARRQIELIREYRTRLIADVVTGKLDVREAAADLPDEPEEREPVQDALDLGEDDADEAATAIEEAEA